MFKRLFKPRAPASASAPAQRPSLPAGERAYAIGDIHGRVDLLDQLLSRIESDDVKRGDARLTLIFLGDLVDRGPHSMQVVDRLIALKQVLPSTRFLKGNHEEVMLLALKGDREALKLFDRIGGRETMLSYGIDPVQLSRADFDELEALFAAHVPPEHIEFLDGFENTIFMGDYVFVHAGVNPERPLDQQKTSDLRWIRRGFLNHGAPLDKMVVHGHTIADDVEWCPHRIGIDTGAFATGRLTALGLEGEERWVLQTEEATTETIV